MWLRFAGSPAWRRLQANNADRLECVARSVILTPDSKPGSDERPY